MSPKEFKWPKSKADSPRTAPASPGGGTQISASTKSGTMSGSKSEFFYTLSQQRTFALLRHSHL